MTEESQRSRSNLQELVVRGRNYKEDYDFELYGEETTAIIRPLVDDEFLPIAAFLTEQLGLEEEIDKEEAVSEAIDKAEEAAGEDEEISITEMDEEFVGIMQAAAIKGLWGGYNDEGEEIEFSEEEARNVVENMMGAYSVELGGRVLEITGDVRDAEKFRGEWGRVQSPRDS